eukprot:s5115_g2.t2
MCIQVQSPIRRYILLCCRSSLGTENIQTGHSVAVSFCTFEVHESGWARAYRDTPLGPRHDAFTRLIQLEIITPKEMTLPRGVPLHHIEEMLDIAENLWPALSKEAVDAELLRRQQFRLEIMRVMSPCNGQQEYRRHPCCRCKTFQKQMSPAAAPTDTALLEKKDLCQSPLECPLKNQTARVVRSGFIL